MGHRIADTVYERLSGSRGAFSTRIAYVMQTASRYELHIADADGANAQLAMRSPASIACVAFSPDGSLLAYVSYERTSPRPRPTVFVHNLQNGKRIAVLDALEDGLGNPTSVTVAWMRQTATLTVIATGSNGSALYSIRPDSGRALIASSEHDDADPVPTADGQWIYFTSNRSGRRQIHRIAASGGAAEQITREGENFAPALSPDGATLAYISAEGGARRVMAMELASGRASALAESPARGRLSFSPNGHHLIFDVEEDGRRWLETISVRRPFFARTRLMRADAAVTDPAWSPYVD